MRPTFDRLEVLRRRSPAPTSIEEVFFRHSGKSIIRNLIFFESAFIADSPAPVSQIKLTRRAVTDRARMVFFAQRFHQGGQFERRIDLPEQLLNDLLAFAIPAFSEVAKAQ